METEPFSRAITLTAHCALSWIQLTRRSMSERWKSYSLTNFIVYINQFFREVNSSNLTDWWKKPRFEAVNDIRVLLTQQEHKKAPLIGT